jgi:hypothetical protein
VTNVILAASAMNLVLASWISLFVLSISGMLWLSNNVLESLRMVAIEAKQKFMEGIEGRLRYRQTGIRSGSAGCGL